MSNRQANKQNSMPVATRPVDAAPPAKKNTTLNRFFHKQQQSFIDTSLNPEMKRKPSYQSDPNLLADSEDNKPSHKKGKGWKWPFPKNSRSNKELPDPIIDGIQPISIYNKTTYFPTSVESNNALILVN